MQIVEITIDQDPIAKKRPRARVLGNHASIYDPQGVDKKHTQLLIASALKKLVNLRKYPLFALGDEVRVQLTFHIAYPKYVSQGEKNSLLWGFPKPNAKPDLDNLEKYILDAANSILWHDDSQIVRLSSKKLYSKTPKTVIKVMSVKQDLNEISKSFIKTIDPDAYNSLIQDISDALPLAQKISPEDSELAQKLSSATSVLKKLLTTHEKTITKLLKWKEKI